MTSAALKPVFETEQTTPQEKLIAFIDALGPDLKSIWPGLTLTSKIPTATPEELDIKIELIDQENPHWQKTVDWFVKFSPSIAFKKAVTTYLQENLDDGLVEYSEGKRFKDTSWTDATALDAFKEAFLKHLYLCAPDENGNYTDDPKNNRKLPIITRYFATTFPNMEGAPWRGDRHSSSIPRARGGFELPGVETQTYKP